MESYKDSIFEPLEYYENHGKATHNDNVNNFFEELVRRSGVDREANRITTQKYYAKVEKIKAMNKRVSKYKTIRILTIVASVILLLISVIIASAFSDTNPELMVILPLLAIAIGVTASILVFRAMNKKIRELLPIIEKKQAEADALRREAEAQMAPLNALFSDNDTFNLIEKTLPQVKFDKQFLLRNLEDLKNNYNFNACTCTYIC